MQGKALNLTEGRPITRILLFSVPLIPGTLFQQLYSFANTLMVGRLVGTDALAVVGATYSLGFLTLGFVQGTCVGFSIPLSQSFGAMRPDEFKRHFAVSLQLCAAPALVMTVLMTVFCAPLLRRMRTPENIFAMTQTYATVIFLGIPASILCRFCAGALRAVGDLRYPFYILVVLHRAQHRAGSPVHRPAVAGRIRYRAFHHAQPSGQQTAESVLEPAQNDAP